MGLVVRHGTEDSTLEVAVRPAGPVLVTGGCGFIGAAVASAFADAGRAVRVVSPRCRPFRQDVRFLDLDIRDAAGLVPACRQAGVRKLVHISSASVVYEGRDIEAGDESLPYAGTSPSAYTDSKIASKKRVLEFAAGSERSACTLRPHIVLGPGDQRFLPNRSPAQTELRRTRTGILRDQRRADPLLRVR
ncbi:NAD-dependent epimerase/dehydratase family protein [Candidatus Palauibacter sp.]|uniref:NAD-dependent epimerase/dehydratase family protein n=1 Tax=Candidatus Palauibacter sp. TaxID=3101350 RepID=UPI003C6F2900